MSLEAATFISSLVATNPVASDVVAQGDDHFRLLKSVLKNTFPNATKAYYFPSSSSKSATFTITAAEQETTYLVNTNSASVTATLPTLVAADAGWRCHFIKTNTGLNPLFIAPASGTLQSGEVASLVKCRRVIPGQRCTAEWTGTAWFVTRVPSVPVGTVIDFVGATLPVGYELPNGQTLSSASTNYPEYFSVNGSSGLTVDITGRVVAMKEAVATRLTAAGSGINGGTLGAAGGTQTHTLDLTQSPAHSHTISITDPGHSHVTAGRDDYDRTGTSNGPNAGGGGATHTTSTNTTGITASSNSQGGGLAHQNTQPTIVLNKILVVE